MASRSLKVAAADEASTQPMPTDQELRVEITKEEAERIIARWREQQA